MLPELDDLGTAGPPMQPVDVLGHEQVQPIHRLQRRECFVGGVGLRTRNDGPPDHAARAVAPSRGLGAQEVLQHHGRAALPVAVFIAVARDARIGTHPRTGQDEQPRIPLGEVSKVDHAAQLCLERAGTGVNDAF
jgi:hypothetical protein